MSTWDDVKARWSADWRSFATAATDKWASTVEASWDSLRPKVEGYLNLLTESQAQLIRAKALLTAYEAGGGNPAHVATYKANLDALTARFDVLGAGVMSGAKKVNPDGSDRLGVAWFVVAGGLALTLAAVCFAVAAYEYCMSLRDNTKLQADELAARVEAMRGGKELQPSTTADPNAPKPTDWAALIGYGIVGSLAIAAVVTIVPALRKG